MLFDKLAEGIIRHHKAILALWVVILVCAVPLALKAGSVMYYDTSDMAGEDSESVKGLQIINDYFPQSSTEATSMPLLVMYYEDDTGLTDAGSFVGYLNMRASEFVDGSGNPKLTGIIPMDPQSKDDGTGILMAGIVYAPSDIDISADTPNLRDFIGGCLKDYIENNGDVGFEQYVTGSQAIGYDAEVGSAQDLQRIDPFTVLLILILVGLFFRSFITSATPPITIGVAFAVVLALIYGIGQVLNVFFITEMMLLVSMMGAGCDYCIFIIARYREELRSGKDHHAALHEAIKWAGESISISGASVIIGFGAMFICSFSMVSTMGICLALGIIVALLAALTLIPSILAVVGDKIFWPSTMERMERKGLDGRGWHARCGRIGHAYFERSSRFSLKHAKAILIVTVLVSVPAAYVAMTSETSYDMISSMENGDSGKGMELIGEYADQGMVMPDYAVMKLNESIANITVTGYNTGYGMYEGTLEWTDEWSKEDGIADKIHKLCDSIIEEDGGADGNISYAYGPFMWSRAVADAMASGTTDPKTILAMAAGSAHGTTAQYVGYAVRAMVQAYMGGGATEEEAMWGVIKNGAPSIDFIANCNGTIIGGEYAEGGKMVVDPTVTKGANYICLTVATHEAAMSTRSMESIDSMTSALNAFEKENPELVEDVWITGGAAVMYEVSKIIGDEFIKIEILVVVLIILMLFLVMKSYTIPFRSVATILMSICWTLAMTHLVFTVILGWEVMWLIPLILLVICLGLGMDYDILLTTRIRENVTDKGLSNDEAIHQAVVHSGSVITICGLIMGGAFGTLMLSNMVMMQQFGFALCFAILVDALIVRTYIVPAVMHLLGDWNWKGPRFLQGKGAGAASEEGR